MEHYRLKPKVKDALAVVILYVELIIGVLIISK